MRLLGSAALILASCQSYEPRALDPATHREAWHARTLEDSSLTTFLERIENDTTRPVTAFDPGDGLSLREGQLVALVFHPELRLARLRVGRALASAEHATLWADPRLSANVLRITESIPDRWVLTPGLAFTIPLSGRLGAEQRFADASLRAAQQRVLEAEWRVWHEVRQAWIEWSAAGLRVEETQRLVEALDALVETTQVLADAGELARTEASLFAVERAQRNNQLRRLHGEAEAAEQRLRAQMGLHPEATVHWVPSMLLPAGESDAIGTPAAIAQRNPSLARLHEEYQVAEESLRREILKQYPDLTLGPLYESDAGQSRVGLSGGIPIPMLNANRRGIAVARAEREIARAAYESEYEVLVGRWAAASARVRGLEQQRSDMEQVLVPLLDRQLEDATQLLRLGEGTGLVLLESLSRAHETKLELIDTRRLEGQGQTELEFLLGPIFPGSPTEIQQEAP